jgi:hypothetical protein
MLTVSVNVRMMTLSYLRIRTAFSNAALELTPGLLPAGQTAAMRKYDGTQYVRNVKMDWEMLHAEPRMNTGVATVGCGS